ncbi:HDOD domain-containing protein [Candidatus Latescibacterota bacterium]
MEEITDRCPFCKILLKKKQEMRSNSFHAYRTQKNLETPAHTKPLYPGGYDRLNTVTNPDEKDSRKSPVESREIISNKLPPQESSDPLKVISMDEEELLRLSLNKSYTIQKILGRGSMASVFLAHELSLDRDVAIKVLFYRYLKDKEFILRFQHEARLAANLEHPCIIRIHQIGEENYFNYIVMNYIHGGTLTQQIKKQGEVPIDQLLLWSLDILSALSYAHEQGIIHRDLKPQNIMIDRNMHAVVTDFGIARAKKDPKITIDGQITGTPRYMSPEQALGREADERSDIYSFGMLFYEIVTKNYPFKLINLETNLYDHVHTIPKPPRDFNPGIPSWLNECILKCIAKSPQNRYQSALELRKAIMEHRSSISSLPSSGEINKPISQIQQSEHIPQRGTDLWVAMQKYDIEPNLVQHIQDVINKMPDIPVSARKLLRMVNDNKTGIKEITRTASTDPVLVSNILKVVNSSFYGLQRRTSNLHFAIVRLGLEEARRIVIRRMMKDQFAKQWSYQGYSTKGIWFHSYAVSTCAEYLAKKFLPRQVGNLVTYGIMHDIGKFALFSIAMRLKEKGFTINVQPGSEKHTLMQREEQLFRVNHAITGGLLAMKWQLPERISEIIEHHHNPSFMDISSIPEDIIHEVTLVNFADIIVHKITENKYPLPEPEPEFAELLNMKYPLEKNITPELQDTISKAMFFIKSLS